jgi:uncharacterized protein YgiM (DUF1202 family)
MNQFIKTNPIRGAAIAALTSLAALSASGVANAQSYGGGMQPVIGCDAPGSKQTGGAVIGALLGAVAGSNLAKNDRGTGTAIGAVAGAAAGSAIGCKMQRTDQTRSAYGYGGGYAPSNATYVSHGYRLSSGLAPASFARDGGTFVARNNLNLRSAPTTGSARVGQLRAGERFQALARVRGSDWILVGQGGIGVGYVHGAYVQPEGGYDYVSNRY